MIATAVAGVHEVAAIAGFGLATLVFVTNGQEILSGLAIGRRGPRGGALRALARGRRQHAGLVVHMGLALVAAGITRRRPGPAGSGHLEDRAEHRVRAAKYCATRACARTGSRSASC